MNNFSFQHTCPVDLRILVKSENGKMFPDGPSPDLPKAKKKTLTAISTGRQVLGPAEPEKTDPVSAGEGAQGLTRPHFLHSAGQ